jgi:tetratricopeptide (TPR) repeat protein
MASERLQQLLDFLQNNPTDSFLRFAIAKEYENLGDHDNALKYYLGIVENDEMYVGTYFHLGKLYEKMEDFEKALSNYSTGMKVAQTLGDRHAYNELSAVKLELEDAEESE